MEIGYKKKVEFDFDEAVEKTREELKKAGFGILTEIDVKKTLKIKLNEDFEDYIILGACNPPFAFKALKSVKEIGLLLPCNVLVYSDKGEIFVSAILPTVAMAMIENEELGKIAFEVENKLKKVINSI